MPLAVCRCSHAVCRCYPATVVPSVLVPSLSLSFFHRLLRPPRCPSHSNRSESSICAPLAFYSSSPRLPPCSSSTGEFVICRVASGDLCHKRQRFFFRSFFFESTNRSKKIENNRKKSSTHSMASKTMTWSIQHKSSPLPLTWNCLCGTRRQNSPALLTVIVKTLFATFLNSVHNFAVFLLFSAKTFIESHMHSPIQRHL